MPENRFEESSKHIKKTDQVLTRREKGSIEVSCNVTNFWKSNVEGLFSIAKSLYREVIKMNNSSAMLSFIQPSLMDEVSHISVDEIPFDSSSDDLEEQVSESIYEKGSMKNLNCSSTTTNISETRNEFKYHCKSKNNFIAPVNLNTDKTVSENENGQKWAEARVALMNNNKIKGRRNIRRIQGDMTMNQEKSLNISQAYYHDIDGAAKEQAEFIQSYLNPKVREILKPHQIDGIEFIWNNLVTKKSGCILAQTMGLGKSLQVILFLDALFKSIDTSLYSYDRTPFNKHVLIICPAYLQQNWVQEFKKWKPFCQFKSRIISLLDKKSGNKYTKLQTWLDNGHVIIMSSNTFSSFLKPGSPNQSEIEDLSIKKALFNPGPSIVIVDEAHIIKSETTQFYQALSNLNTKLRICLTGHPLQNNLLEYYNMIDFATPGLLHSKDDFCNQFKNPIENGFYLDSKESDKELSEKQLKKLIQVIESSVFRLGNKTLGQYIPPKKEFEISIKLSKLQRQIYNKFMAKLKQEKFENVIANANASLIICNHPLIMKLLIDPGNIPESKQLLLGDQEKILERAQAIWLKEIFSHHSEDSLAQENVSLKFEICLSIILQSIMKKEKMLIFSRSIPTLILLYNCLKEKVDKNSLYYMDGSIPLKCRIKSVDCFNMNTNPSIFLISTTSGSHGINLHTASRVILFDIGWNPSIDEQAVGRSYRLGQTKPVVVYRLRTSNTWEDELYPINQKKKAMFQKVVDQEEVYHRFNKTKGDYFCIREDEVAQIENNHEFDDDIIKNMLEKYQSSIVDVKLI